MDNQQTYDVAIIGGGLAGLSLSILFAKAGKKTVVIEKESYPFTKVCGEYISLESWNFLQGLGLDLQSMNLPIIKKLRVTAPDGSELNHDLDLGGFGISRYFLDNELKKIAEQNGVLVLENTKALEVEYSPDQFLIKTSAQNIKSLLCCGSFGKRSNLDVQWNRKFISAKNRGLNNYIGIKYHVTASLPEDVITLHNFKDGYCGFSKIEGDKYCLCYLTTAANLKSVNGDVRKMEDTILAENPHLKNLFASIEKKDPKPVTIAQISFERKTLVEDHIILLGDAAGMITPLCGNGMSMAMHSAKLFFDEGIGFLNGEQGREEMERKYACTWNSKFAKRLKAGRMIQNLFGKKKTTNLFIRILKPFPSLVSILVKQTHGKEF